MTCNRNDDKVSLVKLGVNNIYYSESKQFVVIRDLTLKIFISIYLTLSDGLYFETGLYQGHLYHGFYCGLRRHFCLPHEAN